MVEREQLKQDLKQFICELGKRPDYDLQDDESLVDAGLIDSFALVEIGVFIDEQYDIFIPDEAVDLENMDTLAKITDFVLEWSEKQDDPAVLEHRSLSDDFW